MKLGDNTILITGADNGLGLELAKQLVKAENRVIICGNKRAQLEKARREIPELCVIECDIAAEAGRLSLFSRVTKKFPSFNVLINNACVQNDFPPLTKWQDWEKHRQEIAVNLEAPIHLAVLFIPHLLKQKRATVVHISSTLAISPSAEWPTHCATSAAMHAFTYCMRKQLQDTVVEVIEVVPENVIDESMRKQMGKDGFCVEKFAEAVIARLLTKQGSTKPIPLQA